MRSAFFIAEKIWLFIQVDAKVLKLLFQHRVPVVEIYGRGIVVTVP